MLSRPYTALLLPAFLSLTTALISPVQIARAAEEGAKTAKTDDLGIDEITVTARKRAESLQDTPISITAFTAASLEERNLTNLMEVGNFAPNVITSTASGGSGGGNNAQIYIRGIGQVDFLFTTDPGVGIYVDGVFFPRTLGGVLDLLDLERVEILRGPQGTLFGKNTIGGAISLISAKPSDEAGGYVEATGGRYHRMDLRASVDVPLIADKLYSKFSFSSKNRDGYAKRIDFFTGKLRDRQGNENSASARGALRWIASESVEINFTADYTREREQSAPTTLAQFEPNNGLAPLWNALVGIPSGLPMSTAFITSDPLTTFGTGPNKNDLDAWGVANTVDWNLGAVSLKSITAYREMDAVFGRDGDGSPLPIVHTNDTQTQSQFSQEFQFNGVSFNDRFNWVAGVFFFHESGTDHNDVRLDSGLFDALEALPAAVICLGPDGSPPCAGGAGNPINALFDLDFNINNKIKINSYAGYAQGTFAITEKLSATAGIRYSYEKKAYTLEHLRVNSGVPIVPLTTVRKNWDAFSPKGEIDYKWTEALMTYASVSRGFKSGGFNGRPTTASEVESFNPEFVTTYEAGFKSEWFDRRMLLNVSAFYNDYTDIQIGSVSADSTGNLILIIDNAAKGRVQGFEVEFQGRPAVGLDITGGLGYLDAKYKDVGNATDITLASKFVKTPKWTANASVQYSMPLGNSSVLSIRGDWSYTAKVYQEPTNAESIAQPGFSLFNARLTYENLDGDWEVAVFGTNLADKRYIINGLQALASFGTAEAVYGRPREWGVSVKKRF